MDIEVLYKHEEHIISGVCTSTWDEEMTLSLHRPLIDHQALRSPICLEDRDKMFTTTVQGVAWNPPSPRASTNVFDDLYLIGQHMLQLMFLTSSINRHLHPLNWQH